jgi:hypothetical protein
MKGGMLAALLALAGVRPAEMKRHAGAQAALAVVFAVLATTAFVLAVALGTLALSWKIGLAWALATGAGLSFLAAGIVLILIRRETARHRRLQAEAAARDQRRVIELGLAAVSGLGTRSAVVAALAAVVVGVLVGSSDRDDGDHGDDA